MPIANIPVTLEGDISLHSHQMVIYLELRSLFSLFQIGCMVLKESDEHLFGSVILAQRSCQSQPFLLDLTKIAFFFFETLSESLTGSHDRPTSRVHVHKACPP
jgi:hypothetical protein